MVNENLKAMIENKKPVEEVREIENKIPSYEEFMKTYESDGTLNYDDLNGGSVGEARGYGPGDRKGKREYSEQHLISSLNNKKLGGRKFDWWDENGSAYRDGDFKAHNLTTSSGASMGAGGAMASGSASYSAFRMNDKDNICDVKIGSLSGGGEIGIGSTGGFTAKAELGVDVASVKVKGVQARVGINFDTGGSVGPGGVEASAAGFGFSVGKKTGLKTPLGEASIDFEESCVVQ